ncbi:MAG: adenylate/guanylate cyclase protein [Thermomicrobiales bacterium]|nr:adenylate/guanylate cyclase protein [Thermomicrobiales bacterium]
MPELPSGTVTFLFTDIEGSTALWERDRAAMRAAVDRQLAILQSLITAHHGVLYKTVGDGTQAAFGTAEDALRAALASQRALLAEDWGELGPIRVRMALHAGEAIPDARGEYLAAPLNRLSRLLAAGHGGQILLSQTVQQLTRGELPAGTTLQDLGEHRLRDLLEPERVFQLVHPDLPDQFPPLTSLENRPNNLPRQPTPFLGREREVGEVVGLLQKDDVQLVTLVGPGGTGKTRLALQAAAELLDDFADGVFFVPLAGLSDPDLVPHVIAGAVSLHEESNQPVVEQLKEFLAAKQVLLVLDNVEHLVEAAPVVGDLLGGAPQLKVLVTSRVPLRLRAEREYPVPPLGLPRRKPPPTLEQLSQFEAVRLFIERAQSVKPGFAVDNANAPALAEICHRLDGLPLAIELAAARVRMLSPQAMLARLEQRLPLLTSGARDAPERQRTLRNTIAWSYDLLDPDEQVLLRRLAVFAGGASFEAIEAVANPEGDLDVFGGVERLLEHSLLRQEEDAEGQPRFTMLETIREFGLVQLEESGETEHARQRHAAFFLELTEAAEPHLQGAQQRLWLDRLEAEHDNLRATLDWSRTCDVDTGRRLAAALCWFWYYRGHFTEGRDWLEQALSCAADPSTEQQATLLNAAAALAWRQGDHVPAIALVEEALTTARRIGDRLNMALALVIRGNLALEQGDARQAESLHLEALPLFEACGYTWGVATTFNQLGEAARARGDNDRAATLYQSALHLFRELGNNPGIAMVLSNLAYTARAAGDTHRAAISYREGLRAAREVNDRTGISWCLTGLASLAVQVSAWEQSARLLGAAEALSTSLGTIVESVDREQHEATVAALQAASPKTAIETAWVAGQALPLDQAVAEALALADELVNSLDA